jgi:hypothetical protein
LPAANSRFTNNVYLIRVNTCITQKTVNVYRVIALNGRKSSFSTLTIKHDRRIPAFRDGNFRVRGT